MTWVKNLRFTAMIVVGTIVPSALLGGTSPTGCTWSEGFIRAQIFFVGWGSIPCNTSTPTDVIKASRGQNRRLTTCLYRTGDGLELDTVISRVRRARATEPFGDNTVVVILHRHRKKDTISFSNTQHVTINSKQYTMTRDLFTFIAERMPYREACRMLADTVKFSRQ